jgi:acetyltransferase-like isoleucine patch superfamily enzyme
MDLAREMRQRCSHENLLELFSRFSRSTDWLESALRRACFRALVKRCGVSVQVGINVSLRHPQTFEIGDGVFIGDQAILQGRHDGSFVVGDRSWIGPQCFLDARDLVLGRYVGLGPGVKILGSQHTGQPVEIPIVATDLHISPVRVADDSDIGMGAVLLPGISIGTGAIVGAGAVVTHDVPKYAKVAGVPAQVIGWRQQETDHSRKR